MSRVRRSRSLLLSLWLPPAVLVFAGCSATSTEFDWDRGFDFSRLKTWSWASGDASRGFPDRMVAQRIEDAVAAGFADAGYEQVDSGGDFQVGWQARRVERYRASGSEPVDPSGAHDPQFEHWTGSVSMGVSDASVDYYEEGTLILDVLDPASARVVWRGTAQRMLDRSPTPERSREVIGDAVATLLAEFPPR